MGPSQVALTRLTRDSRVRGAALVGADGTVSANGIPGAARDLGELGASARQIIKQASPPLHYLDLAFEEGRILVLPFGKTVLFLWPEPGTKVRELRDTCQRHRAELLAFDAATATRRSPGLTAQSTQHPDNPQTTAHAREPHLVHVFEATTHALLEHLGALVVRNYFRRSQEHLRATYPEVDRVHIDIAGHVTVDAEDDHLRVAAGALLGSVVKRAAAVMPSFGTFEPPIPPAFESTGFSQAFVTHRGTP